MSKQNNGEDASSREEVAEDRSGSGKQEEGPWEEFVGKRVVIDTPTRYIYLGTLVEHTDHSLKLEDVDVHDSEESKSTKEVYIMEAAKEGIRVNRKRVMVPEHRVLSISTLEDTVVY